MDDFAPPLTYEPASFEQVVLPHRDAAFNLAKWLMHHEQDAEDCVQEAYMRAFRAWASFRGTDGRSWFLAIVRNLCYSRWRQRQRTDPAVSFDESIHADPAQGTETAWRHALARELVPRALEQLPLEAREIIVLHEIEGLAYKEIAEVIGLPIGTVMSRLARARQKLQGELAQLLKKELPHEL